MYTFIKSWNKNKFTSWNLKYWIYLTFFIFHKKHSFILISILSFNQTLNTNVKMWFGFDFFSHPFNSRILRNQREALLWGLQKPHPAASVSLEQSLIKRANIYHGYMVVSLEQSLFNPANIYHGYLAVSLEQSLINHANKYHVCRGMWP